MWLKILVLFLLVVIDQLTAQPIISQYSPSIFPGEIFRLHGFGFSDSPQVYVRSNNNGATDTMLTITTNVSDVVTSYIPTNWIMDVYEIYIKVDGQESNRIYANQPIGRMTDMSEVLAGGRLRIFGKNLYYPQSGLTPTVTFIDENYVETVARLDLTTSDSFVLACYAPDGQIDRKKYRIRVDNGYGVPSLIDPIVTGRNGLDILGTGVGWTVCFDNFTANTIELSPVNNASFDDMPRIISALYSFKNGGILKLKAGEYNILKCDIQLPSNFILQGEGVDKTIINYGKSCGNNTNQFYSFAIDAFALVDLTFRHVSPNIVGFHNPHGVSRQAWLRVNFELGHAPSASFGSNQGLISDVNVTTNTSFNGGFVFGGYGFGCSNEFILRRSSFFYETGAMDARLTNNIIFENNRFIRDQHLQILYPQQIYNFRGLEANFMNNFVFMNNHMETLNYDAYTSTVLTNDGETINHEAGGPKPGRGAIGNVTLATSTSITDPLKNFSNMLFQPQLNLAVTILRGPGMGQVRRVIGAYANGTLVVDRPWGVLPTTASVYSTSMISSNWLIKDNTFIGWTKGAPELYLGRVTNITIVGNTYLNNGGPYANPSNRYSIGSATADCIGGAHNFVEESYFAGFSHELYFLNNYMYFTDPNNTAQLGVFGNSPNGLNGMGLIVSGVELRNNTIIRSGQKKADFLVNSPDGFYIRMCNDDINGAVAQGNKLVGTSGFTLGQQSGTVLSCTSTDSLVSNLTSLSCYITSEKIVGLNVADICAATNFLWTTPTAPSSVSNASFLMLSQTLLYCVVLILVNL